MNNKQKVTMWIGVTVICLMGLFPPWLQIVDRQTIYIEKPAGYAFILSPPEYMQFYPDNDHPPDIDYLKNQYLTYSTVIKIDMNRLFIQWICISLLAFGFVLNFKNGGSVMVNYYQGFRRIWILLWVITSSTVLVFTCLIFEPNPALPFASIHPARVQKPLVKPFEKQLDNLNISKWQKISNEMKKEEHEKQIQALSKWESELISAFHTKSYWKNVGLVVLTVGACSVLFWCVWLIGVWIARGFKSKTS